MRYFKRRMFSLIRAGVYFVLLLLAVVVVTSVIDKQKVAVHFSPNRAVQDVVIDALDSAQDHIYLAMFYMSNQDIVNALVRAKERGLDVFAVFDDSQRKSFRFFRHGVNLRIRGIPVRYGGVSYKMHSKFAVVDGAKVLTGSYNWTESAEKKNVEDFVVIESDEIAREYEEQFVHIWETSENP
ncbi:MAG: DUF1669 domain-containing protein [Verrucomicrobiae bacterium]|nr:DUF1669 domain-containing protein [Verrucomicrobiae bacterium]